MFDTLRDLDPTALVAVVESTHRDESVLVAKRMAAVAALLRYRIAAAESAAKEHEYAEIDGFERTAAELSAAMNLSPVAANYLVSHAETLDTRLPRIAALLAEGRTDWRTVRLIIGRTELVSDDSMIAKLDESLAAVSETGGLVATAHHQRRRHGGAHGRCRCQSASAARARTTTTSGSMHATTGWPRSTAT